MGTVIGGSTNGIFLFKDSGDRTYIKGLWETRRKLMSMGMERNLFENIIKESAKIAASRATRYAPISSGKLALSVRAYASKKYTVNNVSKRAYGGVIVATTDYARQVSYGMRHVAGQKAKTPNSKVVWRNTVSTQGNAYMVKAREDSKPAIVKYFNYRIERWIKQNGFETNGF